MVNVAVPHLVRLCTKTSTIVSHLNFIYKAKKTLLILIYIYDSSFSRKIEGVGFET